MLSRIGAVLLAVAMFVLTACGQKTLSPDEIHQRQQEITEEVAEEYGFLDVSVSFLEAGKTVPPVIDENGEITSQEVDVRIGKERPGDVGECHAVVIWHLNSPPDLYIKDEVNKTLMLIQADTSHAKVEENAESLGLADCFT